jgi:uncharacterized phage protein (TIGR01671 family)
MREILFRGKRTDTKEWIEGIVFPQDNDIVIMLFQRPMDGLLVGEEINPETVEQYTGLTDKNDTKIFEGDIIQNVTEGKTAVVQWFSEYSAFMLWCKSENQVYWLYDNDFHNIEVIGNIYDNPELLGGADNGS